MPTCWLNLRLSLTDRVEAFACGARALGYSVEVGLPVNNPRDDDVFVTWNRIGRADEVARQFRRVLVTENASWGNDFAGLRSLHLARDAHNTSGKFPVGDASRWDSLGMELRAWRTSGETIILPQRGIGAAPTAMPSGWEQQARHKYGGRIRAHPGRFARRIVSLRDDLANCGRAVTWGSGAAIVALMLGVPVVSEMPDWVGAQDNTDAGRLAMFRRLAWAQATMEEISSGAAMERLL